ncbi:hypothetical protein O6H91_04G124300 [Diphasiastrum complanatum]|uniref:Uncharacterized protein n=1 Tax=Diphasiastrum complanatum TaxID=34168 RepID=A0ACC2E1N8_DIPCM|nr:hypothetical protein O6H91_04G124300 [Diphasiastrum complanatum]
MEDQSNSRRNSVQLQQQEQEREMRRQTHERKGKGECEGIGPSSKKASDKGGGRYCFGSGKEAQDCLIENRKQESIGIDGGQGRQRPAGGHAADARVEQPMKEAAIEDDSAAQQQAVLESLASYLEGELMVRLQSYSELLAEVEGLNKERLFYHGKLIQIEKVWIVF